MEYIQPNTQSYICFTDKSQSIDVCFLKCICLKELWTTYRTKHLSSCKPATGNLEANENRAYMWQINCIMCITAWWRRTAEPAAHLSSCGQNWISCLYLHYSVGSEFSQAQGRVQQFSSEPQHGNLAGNLFFSSQRHAEVVFYCASLL